MEINCGSWLACDPVNSVIQAHRVDTFAGKPAPTVTAPAPTLHDAKRVALDLLLILILSAPSNHAGRNSTGIWGVNRQGCRFSRPAPWMARGGGPPNHWRITGTPSPSEVPSVGARAFCLLLRFSKVSRRQGGTLSSRYRSNGYIPNPTVSPARPPSRASPLPQLDRGVSGSGRWQAGRLRRQASSHSWTVGFQVVGVGWQAVIAGKPAPTYRSCSS